MFYPVQQNGQWDKAKCILGQTFVSKVNYTLLVFKESHNKLLSYFHFSLWAKVWAQMDQIAQIGPWQLIFLKKHRGNFKNDHIPKGHPCVAV